MVIGGERVKSRPCWMVIGGEREKVGHVGFGRGVTSFFGAIGMSPVKKPEAEVKFKMFFFNEKLPGPKVTSGNVGPDRVSRRASHSFLNRFRCGVTRESRGSPVGGADEGFPPSHLEKESRN